MKFKRSDLGYTEEITEETARALVNRHCGTKGFERLVNRARENPEVWASVTSTQFGTITVKAKVEN